MRAGRPRAPRGLVIPAAPRVRVIRACTRRNATHRNLQGDLLHWARLLDAFDAYLEQHVGGRPDVQLEPGAPAAPFPSEGVLAVLGATATIFENCGSNKQYYGSFEVRGGGSGEHRRRPGRAGAGFGVVWLLRVLDGSAASCAGRACRGARFSQQLPEAAV